VLPPHVARSEAESCEVQKEPVWGQLSNEGMNRLLRELDLEESRLEI
jgi:hypothetical protein